MADRTPGAAPGPPLLAGRCALVTGASRGIGRATARLLARHGAAVAVNYLNSTAAAEELVGDLRALGVRAVAVRGDVADADDVDRMCRTATAELGTIDLLVANATGHAGPFSPGPLLDVDRSDLDALVGEQIEAVRAPIRALAPGMTAAGGGSVVVVGSGMSTHPQPGFGVLSVAKAAVDAAVVALAAELGPRGIRINTVAPDFVETDVSARYVPDEARRAIADRTPLGRTAVPDDVAGAVLMALCPVSSFVTGQRLRVNGGAA